MLKRHEVEILLKAGHSKAEVARLAGVSLCSVKRIAEEVPVAGLCSAPVSRFIYSVQSSIRSGC
jgi:DNA invertase Pin-like site-specific DNA recombinase